MMPPMSTNSLVWISLTQQAYRALKLSIKRLNKLTIIATLKIVFHICCINFHFMIMTHFHSVLNLKEAPTCISLKLAYLSSATGCL